MKKKVLLTGATGFVGSHILKRLIQLEYDIVILIRELSNQERIKTLNGFSIFVINNQLSNLNDLFELYNVEIIIHVATEYGRSLPDSSVIESNILFPIKLIEASNKRDLKLFINTDSYFCKVKGYTYLSQYIKTKVFFKNYLMSISDIQIINLQLEHVYGEFDSPFKAIPSLIYRMLKDEELIELTDGTQRRDFIYILDVVEAYLLVLEKHTQLSQFEEFEVGLGFALSLKEFVNEIHHIIGSKSKLIFGKLPSRKGEIAESKANNTNLIRLGWNPKFNVQSAINKMLLVMLPQKIGQ